MAFFRFNHLYYDNRQWMRHTHADITVNKIRWQYMGNFIKFNKRAVCNKTKIKYKVAKKPPTVTRYFLEMMTESGVN
jgi:hypothetical protein